jgi:hypothetical protein
VKNFHGATLQALKEIVAAAGLDHPKEFMPAHFSRRVSAREVATSAAETIVERPHRQSSKK